VSLQSAKNIFEALDREKYAPVLIGIDKSGHWHFGGEDVNQFIVNSGDPKNIALADGESAALVPESGGEILLGGKTSTSIPRLDAVFPILHGPFGEDGTVQGLLRLADIPFVGPGVLGSAVGMDKDVMKRLLRDAGVPIGKFLVLRSGAGGKAENVPTFAEARAKLSGPNDGGAIFVKPANMGSSVGVSKVKNESEYRAAIADAFRFDTKVILEENIPGREVECSVLGNENPVASLPGEVKAARDFYSYEAKYIDSDGATLEIPAKLTPETTAEVQRLAVKTFAALECQGLSRVDFFIRETGEVLVNEINTMPGFTKISMYPKLWEASGIKYACLLDRLIQLAIERFDKEKRLATSYR
jgi:D-alanine-D-alanine ligase